LHELPTVPIYLLLFPDEKEAKNPGCPKHFDNGGRSLR